MSIVADVMAALDRIQAWKDVKLLPARMDALEKRIAALETKPTRGDLPACPACGARAFGVTASAPAKSVFGAVGALDRTYTCGECGFSETREET